MRVAEAVADPVRRRILELLLGGDAAAGDLAASFDVSRPAVSRHLRVLRAAGLVRAEVVGRRRVYALDRRPLAELDGWLDAFRPLTAPAVTAPAVTAPAVTAPAVTAPAVTAPAVTGPAVTGPAARLDALGTELRRGRRARPEERTRHGRDDAAAAG